MSLVLALEPLARTSEGSKSGPIGLGIILLMCIACYFLFKSMSKHLKTVREDFPQDPPPVVPAATVDLGKAETPADDGARDRAVDRQLHGSDD